MKRIALLAGLCALPSDAYAITWEMARPDVVALAERADAGPVLKVLGDPDSEFVGGTFARGRHVDFYYAGDAAALSRFLNRLAACDGIQLEVRLSKLRGGARIGSGEAAETVPCQWRVSQDLRERPGVLSVFVFLGDDVIDIDKLDLPSWRGDAKRRTDDADNIPPGGD